MVSANGDFTRTHARVDTPKTILIDRSHRFINVRDPSSKLHRDRWLASFTRAYSGLSPASRRLLQAVRRAALMSYEARRGYVFSGAVNRAAIARVLGRSALVPYDIRLLRDLAAKELLTERKRALPRKQYGEIWLGAGAEFVYSLSSDVLYGLLTVDEVEKDRLAELIALAEAKAAQKAAEAARQKALAERDRDLVRYRLPPRKPSLWERLRDWIGF